jgi:predicted O-methyltransferase YrrM
MNLAQHYAERLAVWSDIQDHLEFLHDAVASREKPAVIELGVRSGNSTAALLAACEETGGWLHSCDIDPPMVPSEWYAGPWSFMRGDSVSDGVLSWMPAECDVLFVDTSHTFDQTIAELTMYMPRVKPGGVALFHDIQWLPPAISLPEPGGPVKDALDAWCAREGIPWLARISDPGMYGLGILQR